MTIAITSFKFFFAAFCLWNTLGCQSYQDKVQRSKTEYEKLTKYRGLPGSLNLVVDTDLAVITLVHVRQQHDSKLYTENLLREIQGSDSKDQQDLVERFYETLLKIDVIQKEIYDFVLKTTNSKNRIYLEGVAYPRGYRNVFAKFFKKGRQKEIRNILAYSSKKSQMPQPPYYLGASFVLHENQQRNLVGAEHGGLLNFTTDTYTNPNLSTQMKLDLLKECHKRREQEVLQNILKPDPEANYIEPTIKVLIFGSKHNFADEVISWNARYPEKQIRLVTFTPQSL